MAKWQYKKTKQSNWKLPFLVIVATLLTFMFIVPTIIVIPFKGDNATQASSEQQAEEATAAAPVTLDSPFDVNVLRSETDEVEKVPLEDYVVHVVASEMPADFELEALKAQALAARTYITQYLSQGQQGKLEGGADVTDTVQHQVYKSTEELRQVWGSDYHWKMDKITEAVAATQGKIITYSNQPITPAFFSTSNGYTENSEDYWEGELPYLRTVESPWDEEISPKFFDQKIFTKAELEKKLDVTISSQINDFQLTRTESKRVATAKIGDNTFTGRDIRELLGLPSNDFTISKKDDHYVFTTKGYGHGVGMSQYGANGMAKEGKTYEEIIEYYYQGVQVSTLEKATPKLLVKK